jgi:alginate O-acetyltransferase complex protein AlgI
MVFSSAIFLVRFLPLLLLIYFLIDKKYKNALLLGASIVFYGWGAPKFIFVILGTTLLDFFLVRFMHQSKEERTRKILLAASIGVNLSLLFYFKYSNFFIENFNVLLSVLGIEAIGWTKLILPIGISFYTFETMTYVVDVYRGVHAPQKNFLNYLLYILFFPKLIAGPIIRYHEIADQLGDREARENNHERLMGLIRFMIGLGKKVLIANLIGEYVDTIYGNDELKIAGFDPNKIGLGEAWIAALGYTFQIYFDFSGYSDMALGLGRMFGFKLPENFNNPYIAESITDFWRRWHITLGAWMKNYLYIPLGGNKMDVAWKVYRNLWVVFLLSGLWHGASWNFVLWGAWHGFWLVTERLFLLRITARIGRISRIVFTFFMVMIGWVLFRHENLDEAFAFLKRMFIPGTAEVQLEYNMRLPVAIVVGFLFSWWAFFRKGQAIQDAVYSGNKLSHTGLFVVAIAALLLFLLSLGAITGSSFNPFIYFRF